MSAPMSTSPAPAAGTTLDATLGAYGKVIKVSMRKDAS